MIWYRCVGVHWENIDYAVGDIFEILVSPQFWDIGFTKIFLPGSRSLFVSQSNNRSELISVRIESRFCYYEGFLILGTQFNAGFRLAENGPEKHASSFSPKHLFCSNKQLHTCIIIFSSCLTKSLICSRQFFVLNFHLNEGSMDRVFDIMVRYILEPNPDDSLCSTHLSSQTELYTELLELNVTVCFLHSAN